MEAGTMRSKATIQRLTTQVNENGFEEESWDDYYSNYAYVNKLSGTEYWLAAQDQMQSTVRFIFRWHKKLDDVDAKNYRIMWKNRAFDITDADNVQFKNETVKFNCVEVTT